MPPETDVHQGNKDKTPTLQLQKARKGRKKYAGSSLILRQIYLNTMTTETVEKQNMS